LPDAGVRPAVGLSAFVGCPAAAASAPVLWSAPSRGRQRDPDSAVCGASPRSPRSAISERRSRASGASQGWRLMGATGRVGPAGVTLHIALAQSGARLSGSAAGAQPRPPPIASPAAPRYLGRARGSQRVGTPPGGVCALGPPLRPMAMRSAEATSRASSLPRFGSARLRVSKVLVESGVCGRSYGAAGESIAAPCPAPPRALRLAALRASD